MVQQTATMVALGLCLLCMSQVAFAATFSPANVVEDVSKCPVKNVPWDPKVFDPNSLGDMAALLEKNLTPECYQLAATELITCATDNSLMYSSGCCSKACASGLKSTVTSGCFKQFIKGICGIPDGEKKYGIALFNAAKRCTGVDASCAADLDALGKTVAAATAGKSPAPKAAAVSPAPAAKPADAPASASPAPATATASPAPKTSSAESLQQLATPVLLAAVVALAL